MLYFDDFAIGQCDVSAAPHVVTKEEIIGFASQWDALPMHIDEEAAKATPVGKLIASGVHTVAIGIRLMRQLDKDETAYVAGIGWEKFTLHVPVCPGDALRLRCTVAEKRVSQSKPDRGIMTTFNEILNQDDVVVASYRLTFLILLRP